MWIFTATLFIMCALLEVHLRWDIPNNLRLYFIIFSEILAIVSFFGIFYFGLLYIEYEGKIDQEKSQEAI